MLIFEKADLKENRYNFLTVFQRLIYHQNFGPKRKTNDILKETTALMRNIDYARICDCSFTNLLTYE